MNIPVTDRNVRKIDVLDGNITRIVSSGCDERILAAIDTLRYASKADLKRTYRLVKTLRKSDKILGEWRNDTE